MRPTAVVPFDRNPVDIQSLYLVPSPSYYLVDSDKQLDYCCLHWPGRQLRDSTVYVEMRSDCLDSQLAAVAADTYYLEFEIRNRFLINEIFIGNYLRLSMPLLSRSLSR